MSTHPAIERVRFAQGQRLPAADLETALASELRHQQLHVVAAHRTWGAGVGLRVIGGSAGAAVFPGVAYDAFGRAIVVTRVAEVPLPNELASELELDFVVAFADGCEPLPRFVIPADVRPGLDVPLARFALEQGTLGMPDPTVRKGTSSVGAPRIATGHKSLEVTIMPPDSVFSATVDTSVAGFRTTPSYVVTLAIDPTPEVANVGVLGPFVSIAEPSKSAFRLDVRFGRTQPGVTAGVTVSLPLDVTWLGVEPAPRCDPVSFTT
jgi:hypothetical protein